MEAIRAAMKRPEVLAVKRAVVLRNAAARNAWCPEGHRERYRYLRLTKRLSAAEARAKVESEFSPFERQLQRVQLGQARIVERLAIARADYGYTLGGVAEYAA
jgi:hypothetical protein